MQENYDVKISVWQHGTGFGWSVDIDGDRKKSDLTCITREEAIIASTSYVSVYIISNTKS